MTSRFIVPVVMGFTGFAVTGALHAETTAERMSYVASQGVSETRASKLVGVSVKNKAGDIIGDINDVVFQENGQISTYIVGVGGFLGVGEKNVGVPYAAINVIKDEKGTRSATLDATKAQLEAAPTYTGEKTTFEKVQDGASDMARSAQKTAKDLMKSQ